MLRVQQLEVALAQHPGLGIMCMCHDSYIADSALRPNQHTHTHHLVPQSQLALQLMPPQSQAALKALQMHNREQRQH